MNILKKEWLKPYVRRPQAAKSVEWKFNLCKIRIRHKFQLFDNALRQFPQGGLVGRQVALHEPQFVDKPQPGAGVVEHHQHHFFTIKVHAHPSLSDIQLGYTPGHRTSL